MNENLLQLAKAAAKNLPGAPKPGLLDPAASLMYMVQAWQNYHRIREQEITRRKEIRARAEVEIASIHEQARLLRDVFDTIFTERRENFARGYALLEQGLDKKDDRQIETALTLIVTLIKESPVKQATEAMRMIQTRKPGQVIEL